MTTFRKPDTKRNWFKCHVCEDGYCYGEPWSSWHECDKCHFKVRCKILHGSIELLDMSEAMYHAQVTLLRESNARDRQLYIAQWNYYWRDQAKKLDAERAALLRQQQKEHMLLERASQQAKEDRRLAMAEAGEKAKRERKQRAAYLERHSLFAIREPKPHYKNERELNAALARDHCQTRAKWSVQRPWTPARRCRFVSLLKQEYGQFAIQ